MDENNYNNQDNNANQNNNGNDNKHHHHYDNCWLCEHPLLKHILTALMVLLGAYLAFYTLADWHFKRMMDPVVQMRRMEKNIMREQRQMDKMHKSEYERAIRQGEKTGNYINIEKKGNAYEIIVDLKPFDNNEKNVEVSTDGDELTITAVGESSTKRHDKMTKVIQQYEFQEDMDFNSITKERKGDKYIISVPFKR